MTMLIARSGFKLHPGQVVVSFTKLTGFEHAANSMDKNSQKPIGNSEEGVVSSKHEADITIKSVQIVQQLASDAAGDGRINIHNNKKYQDDKHKKTSAINN